MHGCSGLLFFHSKPSGVCVSFDLRFDVLACLLKSASSPFLKRKTWSASSFCHHRIGFLTNANEKVGATAMFLLALHTYLEIWHRGPRRSQLNAVSVLQLWHLWHMFISCGNPLPAYSLSPLSNPAKAEDTYGQKLESQERLHMPAET